MRFGTSEYAFASAGQRGVSKVFTAPNGGTLLLSREILFKAGVRGVSNANPFSGSDTLVVTLNADTSESLTVKFGTVSQNLR
jgi:hypothetical protein